MAAVNLTDFLSFLFGECDKSHVPYAVARNYERLGEGNPGRDIDLLVEKEGVDFVISCLRRQVIVITAIIRREYVTSVYCAGISWAGHTTLEIDLVHRLDYRAIPYLDIADVLKRRRPYACGALRFWVPDHLDEAIVLLMENLLVSGTVKEAYREKITAVLGKSETARARVAESFGKAWTHRLFHNIEAGNLKIALEDRRCMAAAFFRRGVLRHPLSALRNFSIHVCKEILIRISPKSRKTICFIGPDGAGKSTLILHVAEKLKYAAGKITIRHLKPVLFFRRRATDRGVVTEPHALPVRSSFLSTLKILLWWFELWADRLSVFPKTFCLEIYDRGMWDVLVDPKRYRFSGNQTLLRLLLRLSPKIDLVTVVVASPERIQSRKAEVPLHETVRQVSNYVRLATDNHFPIIVNEADLEDAVSICTDAILERLALFPSEVFTSQKQPGYFLDTDAHP